MKAARRALVGSRAALAFTIDGARATCVQIRRGKLTYCLGLSSVLLTVVMAAVLQTVVAKAPLIFLREAESSAGQRDVELTPSAYAGAGALNYTRLASALEVGPSAVDFSYHSPRLRVSGALLAASGCVLPSGASLSASASNQWMYRRPDGAGGCTGFYGSVATSCIPRLCPSAATSPGDLLLLDSALERRAGVGRAWDGPSALGPGETILGARLAARLGVGEGDTVIFRFSSSELLRHAFAPPNATLVGWANSVTLFPEVALPLRVVGVRGSFAGKLPNSDTGIALAEFGTFLGWAAPRLHPALARHAWRDEPLAAHLARSSGGAGSSSSRFFSLRSPRSRLYDFAGSVVANLAPVARLRAYQESSYDRTRAALADFGGSILYVAGFSDTDVELPLLAQLEPRRFVLLYMGVLVDSLLITLFALSAVLVYSLLLIDTGRRVFELAVRRMLGSRRAGIVVLLLLQAAAYGIPAWIAGLIISQILAAFVLRGFASLSGIPVELNLTGGAVLSATAMGLLIPVVASIGPIKEALGPTIRDALDADRPKASAVKFTLERASDGRLPWPVIAGGALFFVVGLAIYYLVPLALISLNITLLLNVFIAVLLGLLAGLTLLALNLELLTTRGILALLCAWWERASVLRIARANLVAHRLRNRKTALMYALSIAFIVFLSVAAAQQVTAARFALQQKAGAPLVVVSGTGNGAGEVGQFATDPLAVAATDAATRRYLKSAGDSRTAAARAAAVSSATFAGYSPSFAAAGLPPGGEPFLRATAWGSRRLEVTVNRLVDSCAEVPNFDTSSAAAAANAAAAAAGGGGSLTAPVPLPTVNLAVPPTLFNLGRLYSWALAVQGVGPAGLGKGAATYDAYFSPGTVAAPPESTLLLGEQLYTARGGQAGAFSSSMRLEVGLERGGHAIVQSAALQSVAGGASSSGVAGLTGGGSGSGAIYTRTRVAAGALMDGAPFFAFSRVPSPAGIAGVVALSALPRLADQHATRAAGSVQRVPSSLVAATWAGLHALWSADSGWAAAPAAAEEALRAGDALALRLGALEALLVGQTLVSPPQPVLRVEARAGLPAPAAAEAAAAATSPLRGGVSIDDVDLSQQFLGFVTDANGKGEVPKLQVDALVNELAVALQDAAGVGTGSRPRSIPARSGGGAAVPVPPADPEAYTAGWGLSDAREAGGDLGVTLSLLDVLFNVLTLVALSLCFFSLLASMASNIAEQRKEMGVLRSLGLTRGALLRVYGHEAFALVVAASLQGIVIGSVVAYTFGAQQSLFTSIATPFLFPYSNVITVVAASAIAALASSWGPAGALLRLPITSLLRAQ